MYVHHLTSVDGHIVFDLDPEVVERAAGGTRLAEDVTVDEVSLLARAMTYKFAVFGLRLGGAKAGIRLPLVGDRDEVMRRYVDEIRPMVESGRFLTGPDLGTAEADFRALSGDADGVFSTTVDSVPFEEVVTGHGVVAAAAAWSGGLDGATLAVEGFGKVGSGVARAAVAAGARILGVSTFHGAVADAAGLDLAALLAARAEFGDRFVRHLGLDVRAPADLHRLPVDVLVPGARPGVLDAARAARVRARIVAPAANVPYTAAGLDTLRAAGVTCLPDFVANAGAVLAYVAPRGLGPAEVLDRVRRLVAEQVTAAREAGRDPFTAAVESAELFLSTWVPAEHLPTGPPLAPDAG